VDGNLREGANIKFPLSKIHIPSSAALLTNKLRFDKLEKRKESMFVKVLEMWNYLYWAKEIDRATLVSYSPGNFDRNFLRVTLWKFLFNPKWIPHEIDLYLIFYCLRHILDVELVEKKTKIRLPEIGKSWTLEDIKKLNPGSDVNAGVNVQLHDAIGDATICANLYKLCQSDDIVKPWLVELEKQFDKENFKEKLEKNDTVSLQGAVIFSKRDVKCVVLIASDESGWCDLIDLDKLEKLNTKNIHTEKDEIKHARLDLMESEVYFRLYLSSPTKYFVFFENAEKDHVETTYDRIYNRLWRRNLSVDSSKQ
jgi:hypothetical protein